MLLLDKGKRHYALYIILTFFSVALLFKAVSYYLEYSGFSLITSGGGNIYPFIQDVWVVFIGLLAFIYLKKMSKKELITKSITYPFFVLEIGLTLFVSLVLIKRIIAPGTGIINLYLFPLFILILGLYFYILLESLKKYLIKKLR